MSRVEYEAVEGGNLTDAHIRFLVATAQSFVMTSSQKFMRELADALDAMEHKRLIADHLERDGEYCALGVVGRARGIQLGVIDPSDIFAVAEALDILNLLALEIVSQNDDRGPPEETPEQRWARVREFVRMKIKP